MKSLRESFPDAGAGEWFECPPYEALVESLGLAVDVLRNEGDRMGPTFMLVRDLVTDRFGFLTLVRGSCGACDLVLAAHSYEAAELVRDQLIGLIEWSSSRQEMYDWIDSKAWDDAHAAEGAEFKRLALERLRDFCVEHEDCRQDRALGRSCVGRGMA